MGVKVVLGYGLGVDSTAILLRWIYQPWTRPEVLDEATGEKRTARLDEIVVVTAMTGDEWRETGRLVRENTLPLMREHGIRYVQLARHGASKADGITILDDSACPVSLYLEGDYKLSQEMNANGTVPQVGGIRKCSMHAKGEVIDRWLIDTLQGAPFLHVIGFEANELGRAKTDRMYNTGPQAKAGHPANRTGSYPLIEWGWDRAMCEAYITEMTAENWIKSACVYCPFALATKGGQERIKGMYASEPDGAIAALLMEYRSISLNPAQGLIKADSLQAFLRRTGEHDATLAELNSILDGCEWNVYEVQRVAMPNKDDASKGTWNRSVRAIAAGTRGQMLADLMSLACDEGASLVTDFMGISRVWTDSRGEGFPSYERLYVAAPAGVQDKEPKAFRTTMERYAQAVAA